MPLSLFVPTTGLRGTLNEEYLKRFLPLKPTMRQRFSRCVRRLKKLLGVNLVEVVPRAVDRMRGIEWATAPEPVVFTTACGGFGGVYVSDGSEGGGVVGI